MRRLLVLCALALAACGKDSTGPSRIEAEGQWVGPVHDTDGSVLATLTLTVNETAGAVTGSGNIANAGASNALTVTGTYTPPNLSMTLSAPGFSDMNLTATVGETSMTGTLNGSGFVNSGITLTRQ